MVTTQPRHQSEKVTQETKMGYVCKNQHRGWDAFGPAFDGCAMCKVAALQAELAEQSNCRRREHSARCKALGENESLKAELARLKREMKEADEEAWAAGTTPNYGEIRSNMIEDLERKLFLKGAVVDAVRDGPHAQIAKKTDCRCGECVALAALDADG